MKKKIVFFISIIIFFCSFLTGNLYAKSNLDEIQNYNITVDTRNDGSLDIKIDIIWKVLDSSSEGPLEWVKIGVPNYHIDQIQSLTNNIDEIGYYSDNGAFIKIVFDKKYYKNEIVNFSFKFHQEYMYTIDEQNNLVHYSYTPGWFDEIEVKNIYIYWNMENVLSCSFTETRDNYYYKTTSLTNGEKINVNLNYSIDNFENIDLGKQYTNDYNEPLSKTDKIIIFCIFGAIGIIILSIAISSHNSKDEYYAGRGFTGTYYPYYSYGIFRPRHRYDKSGNEINDPVTMSGTNGSNSTGSSCACACACACAGGGRAGCSRKDYYHTNLKTKEIESVLNK